MSKALPLDVQNLFEEQIDSRIDSAIKRYDARSGEYPAVVTRQGTDGMWWCRVVGNEEETPIMTTLTEMSVGDTIRLVIKDGRTTAQGNETAPAATNVSIEYSVQASLNPVLADLKDLNLDNAKIKTLVADRATIEDLEAEKARIGILEVNTADISDIRINAAKVQNLTAAQLEADHATVESLDSNYAHITNGVIDNATIGYADVDDLDANYAHMTNGVIDNATIGYADVNGLSANYAQVNMANVNNAWISNGVVKDGAISNAMINSVSANKLTAGTIDASDINVTNLRADTLIVNKVNGQPVIGGYVAVDSNANGYSSMNPQAQGWYEISNGQMVLTTDTAVNSAKAYYSTSTSVSLYDQSYIDSMEDTLNDRIDGAIETFTGTAVPTLQNTPASSWNTAALKDQHVGDVYYVVNSQSQQNGYCYRFTKSGTGSSATYSWQLIKDSDVTAALSRLQTAEGKIGDIEAFDVTMSTFKTDTEGAISTLQTKTTNLETSLGDKVSTSTFNELSQTVEGNSATITTLSTTTQTLRTDLDNLEIGGRNLLTGTSDEWEEVSLSTSQWFLEVHTDYELEVDQQYTFSIIVEKVSTDSVAINLHLGNGLKGTYTHDIGSWRQNGIPFGEVVSLTHTVTAADLAKSSSDTTIAPYLSFRLRNEKNATTIRYKCVKLEKGNKATDWTPAPEDLATVESVTTVSNTVNQVSQTATSNSSKISQLTTTLGTNADGTTKTGDIVHRTSAVEQDLSGFKSTVSSTYATKTELDSLEIGGRNLLLATPRSYNSGSYDAYKLAFNDSLEIGQKYTVQLWDVDVSHSGKTAEQLGVMVYIGGGSANTGVKWQGTSYFTNGHADHLSGTFTYTQGLHDSDGGTNKWLVLFNSAPTADGTRSMSVGKWKMEKGDKATDWTPAPEDMASASSVGAIEPPYTEVEWVESNGKQFVYLDWKPPIATWGFEADFIVYNAFSTTAAAWNASTNKDGYGCVFGVRNEASINDVELDTYGSTGLLRNGTGSYMSGLLKTDGTRQTVSYIGTSLKRGDGTTVTWARTSETANKPYANMTVFAAHSGLRRGGSGNLTMPSSVRIYSLKFYESTTLKVDLVGAIRRKDGATGLYDKVAGKFYPAPGMTYGNPVGELGEPETIVDSFKRSNIKIIVDNIAGTRMWRATVPDLEKLEDGQQITVTPMYGVVASAQTSELSEWDDTTSNSNVFMKLTLADGSETEWVPCYYTGVTRLTTHYGAGIPLLMTYREDVFYNASATAVGSVVMKGWFRDPNYDTNDTYTRYSDSVIAGKNGVKCYSLCMKDDAGNITSIVNQNNNRNATGKTCYTGGLQLGGVYYHNSGTAYAAGASTGQIWESRGGIDFRYNVNGVTDAQATTELQLRKPVYLVGTLNDNDGLFYLDTTKWWTQTSFTTGKVYVLVGHAYSSYYAIFLAANNPSYIWNGTKLVEFEYSRIVQAETKIEQTDNSILSLAQAGATWTAPDGTTQTNQTAAKLELKANKATLTSEINASADTIKISADRVNIEGATLFTSGRLSSTSLNNAYDAKGSASTAETNAKAYADAIEVGGRNLLLGTPRSYVSENYDAYKLDFNDPLEIGQKYTVQLWDVDVSHSGKTAEQLGVMVYIGGGSANTGVKWQGTSYFTNGHADHLSGTFTYTQGLHDSDGGTNKWLVLFNSVPSASGTCSMSVGKWKLEKGTKATDWTPAPEDTDAAITTSSYQTAQPNLCPYLSVDVKDTTYWQSADGRGSMTSTSEGHDQVVNKTDGWAHILVDARTSAGNDGSKSNYMNLQIEKGRLQGSIKPGGKYTWMLEVANLTSEGISSSKPIHVQPSVGNETLDIFSTVGVSGDFTTNGVKYVTVTAKSSFSSLTRDTRGYVYVFTGCYAEFDLRVSLYEGEYSGPYKPYTGDILYANSSDSVEYIVGTQTGTTNVWTGVTRDSALYTGKKIAYYLPYAGNSSAATLNLTLAGGGTTGAKNVRWNNTNITTHYPQYSVIQLVYDGTYWRTSAYNSDTFAIRYASSVVAGLNGAKRYSLCMQDKNGLWTSIVNQDNNTAASGKTCYTGGLQLGKVLYHNANAAYASGANTGEMWESRNTFDFRYSVNGVTNDAGTTTLQLRKLVYLVGTIGDDGLYYLDTSKWWTQEPNDTEKVYVLVGSAHNSGAPYQVNLIANNTACIFDGIGLVEYASSRINSAEQGLVEQATVTEQVQQGVNDLDNYVRGYSYEPIPDRSQAQSGVTYYERTVTATYSQVTVASGAYVSGYYTKSGNNYLPATGTAVGGTTYYERLESGVASYAQKAVTVGATLQNYSTFTNGVVTEGYYIYTDTGSLYGRINSTNTRVENGFAEQDGINNTFRASIAAVQTELHSAVLVDPDIPNVTVGYMNDQQAFQGYRSVLGPNGMEIVAPAPNDTSIAMYGATQRIGAENAPHMVSDGSTLMFLPADKTEKVDAVAYIAYDEGVGESYMYMTRSRVVTDLEIGKWSWRPRANGNLSLKWIGGE